MVLSTFFFKVSCILSCSFLQYSILGGYPASGTMQTVDMTEAFHLLSKHSQANRILADKKTYLLSESIFEEQKALDKL